MNNGRTFTPFAKQDPEAITLLEDLLHLSGNVEGYRDRMRRLGARLASSLLPRLRATAPRDICVVCTVEDADFLACGLIDELALHDLGGHVRLTCLWNHRVQHEGVAISPVLRSYEEPYDKDDAVFIIVKSIISGACVVRTNLTKAITSAIPKRIFVVAPVMLKDAEIRLANEFPVDVSRKFEFVHFATDTEKSPDGTEVVPGIGGSVYELLGLGDGQSKNRYVPAIVRERRRIAFPALLPT